MLLLALTGDQWLTLAALASGALIGLSSLVFAYFNGRSERTHGERLARSDRLHEQRFAAYKEVARLLERQRLYLTRTEPLVGPKPDPPRPLDDEEWATVSGLVAISPSADVLAALEDASQRTNDFEIHAFTYRRIRIGDAHRVVRVLGSRVSHEPDSPATGLGLNSFQCPSETTSTEPSTTLMAVCSSMA